MSLFAQHDGSSGWAGEWRQQRSQLLQEKTVLSLNDWLNAPFSAFVTLSWGVKTPKLKVFFPTDGILQQRKLVSCTALGWGKGGGGWLAPGFLGSLFFPVDQCESSLELWWDQTNQRKNNMSIAWRWRSSNHGNVVEGPSSWVWRDITTR